MVNCRCFSHGVKAYKRNEVKMNKDKKTKDRFYGVHSHLVMTWICLLLISSVMLLYMM